MPQPVKLAINAPTTTARCEEIEAVLRIVMSLLFKKLKSSKSGMIRTEVGACG
ncbi:MULTISPECIES: hypothetical protein [Duganella]|uniref:hypothetical protein n=1 Tax=Duganella TaxID=75654 RepID=UPI001581B0BB|nr:MULTISPECIES: hypothetical protein [Duganella]MCU6500370.1 hypothetical protein [Rugamonas sp. A1-17]